MSTDLGPVKFGRNPVLGPSGGRFPSIGMAVREPERSFALGPSGAAVELHPPQPVVRNTRPTSVPVKTNRGKDENRRTGKSPFQSLGDSRERPRAILLDCPSKPRRESRSFSEEKRTCGVFATLFCLKFTGRMRFEPETCYYSTRMVRVLYPRTPPWWSYDPGVAAFPKRNAERTLGESTEPRHVAHGVLEPDEKASKRLQGRRHLRPDRSEAANRSQTREEPHGKDGAGRNRRTFAMKHRFFPPTRSKIGRAYDLGEGPQGKEQTLLKLGRFLL